MSALRKEAYFAIDREQGFPEDITVPEYEAQEPSERFVVQTLEQAAWAVRKIEVAEEQIAERQAFVMAEIERLQGWLKKANSADEQTVAFMHLLLQPFVLDQVQANGKKSITMPGARMGFTKQQPRIERNDAAIIEWLEAQGAGEYIKTEQSLRWGELKKACTIADNLLVTANGEVVPSVEITQLPDTFRVTIIKEDA